MRFCIGSRWNLAAILVLSTAGPAAAGSQGGQQARDIPSDGERFVFT